MKSTEGKYYIGLDHIRAVALFMVFTWHFTHCCLPGKPILFTYTPFFLFCLLDEGHTGVALFMTLSGYLFSKLIYGKRIRYKTFIWNRIIRLIPLLFIIIVIMGVYQFSKGTDLASYSLRIIKGIVMPTLPAGGWSITIEFHFYLIFPLLLWLIRKSNLLPVIIILYALMLRFLIYQKTGEVQSLAYWTIFGRIDQFLLGMMAFNFKHLFKGRHKMIIVVLCLFALFYWYFDYIGGFYKTSNHPYSNFLWIFIPTIEGIAYAMAIAWYDNSFVFSTTGVSGFIGKIGAYSYSLYLLHFLMVCRASTLIGKFIMPLTNFYIVCCWSLMSLILLLPAGYLCFKYIESPFLKLRKPYLIR